MRAANVLGLVASVLAGCSLLTSYDGFTGGAKGVASGDASIADAGAVTHDGSSDSAATTSGATCVNATPPAPVDAGTNATLTSYFSVTTALRLGEDDGGCPVGINLDGLDTCATSAEGGPTGPACVAANDGGPFCDDPGGIDNSARSFLSSFNVQSSLNAGLMDKSVGFVVGIDDYGGETELAGVHVNLYNLVGESDGGGVLVDPASYVSGVPVYTSSSAYVHEGILAATFPKFPLTLRAAMITGGFVSVHAYISDMQLLGRPRLESDGLHIDDGQLAGRITSANLLYALSEAVPCAAIGATIADLNFCNYLDLPTDPAADGTSAPCGALSIGFGFDTSPSDAPALGTSPVIQSCSDIPDDPCN